MANIKIVAGPVVVKDNQVLLNKSGEDNFWKFCGGRVETTDLNLFQVAEREAKEEIGVDLELINPEPFLLYVSKETEAGKMDIILVHYLVNIKGEINPGSDIREWAWINMVDLKQENLAPNILPALRHFGFITD